MEEVDFPRGGGNKPKKADILSSKKSTNKAKANATNKTNGVEKKSVKGRIPGGKPKRKNGPVNSDKFKLSPENLHKDVLMLGCVHEVRHKEVIVDLPNTMKGVLREYPPFPHHFVVGQILAVGVAGAPLPNNMIPLTIAPSFINRSLELPNLREGVYVSGEVTSVEDRGYSIATSIPEVSSFITKTEANLIKGQPVFCVITSISPSTKHLMLAPQRDQTSAFQDVKDWKSISFENVRPGNAAKAEVHHIYPNGLGVKIYDSLSSVFIPAEHLPGPLSKFSVGFRINTRVLAVDYLSKVVILSALSHLVVQQMASDITLSYSLLKGLTFPVSAPSSTNIVELPTQPPYAVLLPGKNEYKRKGNINVKIVGLSQLLRRFVVSNDPQVLNNPSSTLTTSDLHPAMIVEGTLDSVAAKWVEVTISPNITKAKCGLLHLADAPINNPKSIFPDVQEHPALQCRVLYVDDDSTVHLTNKPTLVNSSLRVISNYQHAIPGCVAHGWISKISKTEVSVSFYNHVTGHVPNSDIEGDPHELYHLGQVVVCQVVECTSVGDKSSYNLQLTFDVQLARSIPDPAPPTKLRNVFQATTIGQMVSGIVSHTDKNGLTLVLESGIIGVLPTSHLSDHPSLCSWQLGRYYVGTQIKDIRVLNKDSSSMRLVLTKKPSLCRPAEGEVVPSTYDEIEMNSIVIGHVKQISDSHYTIGFLGTCKATAEISKKKHLSTPKFVLGQTVRALVTDFDSNKKDTVKVSLTNLSTATDGAHMLREYFSEIDGLWSRMKLSKLHYIGEIVEGNVLGTVENRLMVQLSQGITAFVDFAHIPQERRTSAYPEGYTVRGVVIDIDYVNATLQLSMSSDLVDNIVDTESVSDRKELLGTVLLVKPTYLIVAVTPAAHTRSIVYVPVCDYNRAGMEKAAFYSYRPGMSLRVAKVEPADPVSSKDKPRPIFIVADSSIPQTIKSLEEGESEGEDEEGKEMDDGGEGPDFIFEDDGSDVDVGEDPEDNGNVFAYNDESDDEEDPDLDSLQVYLAKQSRKKPPKQNDEATNTKTKKRTTKSDTKQAPKKKFKK